MPQRTSNPEVIARRVKRLQHALMLDCADTARLFGVTRQAVKQWSSGRNGMSLEHQRVLVQLEDTHHQRLQTEEVA